jgi:hypothetical protein
MFGQKKRSKQSRYTRQLAHTTKQTGGAVMHYFRVLPKEQRFEK